MDPPLPLSHAHSAPITNDLAECGWRYKTVTQADGTTTEIMVPLTEEDFLHPQEDDHFPSDTFHDLAVRTLHDILSRRYAHDPSIGVYGNLIIDWQRDDLKDHCPDLFVVFGISQRDANRTQFFVNNEGALPAVAIEVVSPRYRKTDREIKVEQYARAGIQEYLILDRRQQRGKILDEVLGYRLVNGQYLPLTPDDDGLIYLATLNLSIGLQDQRVIVIDAQTGDRLLTSLELEHLAEQERQRAEQERQRADRLAALLRAQGIDPE